MARIFASNSRRSSALAWVSRSSSSAAWRRNPSSRNESAPHVTPMVAFMSTVLIDVWLTWTRSSLHEHVAAELEPALSGEGGVDGEPGGIEDELVVGERPLDRAELA